MYTENLVTLMPAIGRRGSRSDSVPIAPERMVVLEQSPPSRPFAVAAPEEPRPHLASDWIGPVVGFAAGGLLGRLVLSGLQLPTSGAGVGELVLLAVGIALAVRFFLRRHAKPRPLAATAPLARRSDEPPLPAYRAELDRGVRDIRRADRGFDPARFAGYAGMMFRDVQSASMARDAGNLRDRLTPPMYGELQASFDRLRAAGRSIHFEGVGVSSETTEAWQDGDRDYVTAYVAGSMLRYAVEDATGKLVDGSRTMPTLVEEFLTFTRPAGLNFWMLSIIQGARGLRGQTESAAAWAP